MTPAELNHLHRLLGWISCEIGPAPDETRATVTRLAESLDEPTSDAAGKRLVEGHDKARQAPKYVRAALAVLQKTVGASPEVVDAQDSSVPRRLNSPN